MPVTAVDKAALGRNTADALSKKEACEHVVQVAKAEASRLSAQADAGLIDKSVAERALQNVALAESEASAAATEYDSAVWAENSVGQVGEGVAKTTGEDAAETIEEEFVEDSCCEIEYE